MLRFYEFVYRTLFSVAPTTTDSKPNDISTIPACCYYPT
jgi:hypothetical protein